jgi:acetoin utilization deacetylase AcuC-like enzyme
MKAFRPKFIFLSAGFDAHRADPIGDLALSSEDFGRITRAILDVARTSCEGRVVSVLEGGYAPSAVAAGGRLPRGRNDHRCGRQAPSKNWRE